MYHQLKTITFETSQIINLWNQKKLTIFMKTGSYYLSHILLVKLVLHIYKMITMCIKTMILKSLLNGTIHIDDTNNFCNLKVICTIKYRSK